MMTSHPIIWTTICASVCTHVFLLHILCVACVSLHTLQVTNESTQQEQGDMRDTPVAKR